LEYQRRAAKRQTVTRRVIVIVLIAAVVITTVAILTNSGSHTPLTAQQKAQNHANSLAVAAGCHSNPNTRANNLSWASAPAMTINVNTPYYATVSTTQGTFVIQLLPHKAPITVNNFVFLANQSFYKCVTFHRVIPGFMNQTGDPTGTGQGGPGYTIPDEYPPAGHPTYPLYSVAMANTGQPHTGGSQFFIVAGSSADSLGNTYSLFGQVISGMSVVQAINQQGNPVASANGVPPDVINRMLSVTITNTP
jgi:peptidylprolyl isomerase/peptidyl-prolyl cis-trans isomerase B (cyclophilin B)